MTRGRRRRAYCAQLLITQPKLRLVLGARLRAVQDLIPILNPALRSGLAEVDFLSLVPSAVGVEKNPAFIPVQYVRFTIPGQQPL